MPADLRNCGQVPRAHFQSLWIMGFEPGISVEVTDMLCDQIEETCPFNNEDPFLKYMLKRPKEVVFEYPQPPAPYPPSQ